MIAIAACCLIRVGNNAKELSEDAAMTNLAKNLGVAALLCLSVSTFALSNAQAASFTNIDVGVGYTLANGISENGTVVGSYCNGTCVGFTRAADGTVTTFSAGYLGTGASAINEHGTVTGVYGDVPVNDESYVRTADGQITLFSGTDAQETLAAGINNHGVVAGTIRDTHDQKHGFLRTENGKI